MAVLPAVKMNWMYVLWYPVWQRHSSERTIIFSTDALMSSKEASRIMKEEKEESVLASPDFMFTEDLEMLKQENVSGDIALRFFDHDGQECNTTLKERMISISMEQFKKIDRKISLVSGVSKANAVLSALKGGLVDVLILDSNLAEALLKLTQE